jgi:tetratricopeptide (TPR) repeat protein
MFKINTKQTTWILIILIILSSLGAGYEYYRIKQIQAFNDAILHGKSPVTDMQSFEAKFATAYWLAVNERYKESTLLYTHLLEKADDKQKATIQHNLGNIYFLRGLAINGTNMTVGKETEYLLRQAKNLYQQSLKIDNSYWGTKHNLDRLIMLLPGTPTPGVGESDSPGLIMGNIPVGLP